jgi:hypothetical protein
MRPGHEAANCPVRRRDTGGVPITLDSDREAPRRFLETIDRWEVGERTVLRGRLEATSLASPRA